MMRGGGAGGEAGPSGRDIGLLLVATAGLAACITLVFLGMRAVMDIGGSCASGGPFVPVRPCPDGVDLLMVLGIFGLFGFGGLGFYAGANIGGAWIGLPLLAWPGLFLSLGWNFLEYGFWPPGGGGWEWGWVIPGFLFVLMGGIPLLIAWRARREFGGPDGGTRVASTFGLGSVASGQSVRVSYGWHLEHRPKAESGAVSDTDGGGSGDGDLVERLERLAHLRRSGDITSAEFEAAKAALLAATWADPRAGGTS